MLKRKTLRSGYTTGACAAAAAKAAATLVMRHASCVISKELPITHNSSRITVVEIPFPDGSRVKFRVHNSELLTHNSEPVSRASVIKDAGDDPDVTNGAEIVAEVRIVRKCGSAEGRKGEKKSQNETSELPSFQSSWLIIRGGNGVGIVTKPGLAVPVGEAAINPIPRRMITEAVTEAVLSTPQPLNLSTSFLEVTISVPEGGKLAKKTLNYRLGIEGGISILGTTGIVRPVSSEAWTATISSSMDVAKAMRRKEIVLSAGRASEKAHIGKFNLPEESYVMMGDYLEYSLLEAKKHGFKKMALCAQWAKMLKIAMTTPQTHVRHGAIDMEKTKKLLISLGVRDKEFRNREFNTARDIFDFIKPGAGSTELFSKVCLATKKYAEEISGVPVKAYLISYEGDIISESE